MTPIQAITQKEALIPLQYHPRALIELCLAKGVDQTALLEGTDIQSAHLHRLWQLISYQQYVRLIENALALTGEPQLGLEFGKSLSLGANGIVGFAMFSGKTVEGTLKMSTQYKKLISPITRILYHSNDKELHVQGECTMTSGPLEIFFIETLLTTLTRWFNDIAPGYQGDVRYCFKYPAPAHAEYYTQYFPGPIQFNAAANEIICDRQILDIPLQHASSFATREALDMLARRIKDMQHKEGLISIIRDQIRQQSDSFPTLEEIATALQVSPTTLKRKLSQHNTSFQKILDDVKRGQAIQYLIQSRLPISDIAERMGYFSSSNFRRAFKQWTGKTPSDYRQQQPSDEQNTDTKKPR